MAYQYFSALKSLMVSPTCRILFIAVLAFTGCTNGSSWTTCDSWQDSCPNPIPWDSLLPQEKIHPVTPAKILAASTLLATSASIAITSAQAAELTGITFSAPTLYLVRAVSLNERTGRFTVHRLPGNALTVLHGSLGRSPVPMRRHPLVLELDEPPSKVYVDCGMAE